MASHQPGGGGGEGGGDGGRRGRGGPAASGGESTRPSPSLAVEHAARIVLRPIANPLPLGFLALAGGTTVVAGVQLEWIAPHETNAVALILVAFVTPLQLLASVLGFLGRDAVAGTGMGILAGTWLSVGLVLLIGPPGATSEALGTLLLVAALAMLIAAVGAAASKLVPMLVLATTAIRFAVTGVYELDGTEGWKDAAGIVGLVLGAVAVYAALAMLIEDVRRGTVLPVLRHGRGRETLVGNLDDQLRHIEREAGVREQL